MLNEDLTNNHFTDISFWIDTFLTSPLLGFFIAWIVNQRSVLSIVGVRILSGQEDYPVELALNIYWQLNLSINPKPIVEHWESESSGEKILSGNGLTQSASISERKERKHKGACLNHIVQCTLTCLWDRQSKFLKNSWNHVKKTKSYDTYWYPRRRGWGSLYHI